MSARNRHDPSGTTLCKVCVGGTLQVMLLYTIMLRCHGAQKKLEFAERSDVILEDEGTLCINEYEDIG